MRILALDNDPGVFDEKSSVRARMRAYADAMGELHIVSPAPLGAREARDGTLHVYPCYAPKLLRARVLANRARALILAHDIEVVTAQDPFEQGIAALRAVRGTNAKLHVQVHTDFLSPWFVTAGGWRPRSLRMAFLNRIRRNYADEVLPRAQGIRAVSERVKGSLVARYAQRIVEPSVIPITVDADLSPPVPLPAHSFTFALIAVGRLEPEKRVEDILDALARVVPTHPAVGLFVVGEGRERARLERAVRTLHLDGRVIFLGNRSDAPGLMQSAQAFVQASAYEGYGRTLIEAALAKVPIISTEVGIVGEVFVAGEDALVVPIADPAGLARAITGLLEDDNRRAQLSYRAEGKARAHLTLVGDLPTRVTEDLRKLI